MNNPRIARGPQLPYVTIAGVTPLSKGWLIASARVIGANVVVEEPKVVSSFRDVLERRMAYEVLGINAAISFDNAGDIGQRPCDVQAKGLLGQCVKAQKSSASTDRRLVGCDELSMALYLEASHELSQQFQKSVYEVMAELSFYQMNAEHPLTNPASTEKGNQERAALLDLNFHGVERLLESELDNVAMSDRLAAGAALWTARRIHRRMATRIPSGSAVNPSGIAQEISR